MDSAAGIAYIYNKCKTLPGTNKKSKTNNCGAGYGNHVKILHANGYMSIYAHLEKIYVKNAQKVKRNQLIGLEGNTGSAAYRHLHWDIHKLYGNEKNWNETMKKVAWGGRSIPFRVKININGTIKIIESDKIACRWLDMTQPKWKGTFKTK